MTGTITYAIGVAWSDNLTGVFRVGYSTVGGTDLLPGGFGYNVFDDISSYVREIATKRGRSSDLGAMQQGTCTVILHDRGGRFNPENPSSDLYGQLVPLRPIKIDATHLGITYPIFRGYIERIEHDPLHDTTKIDAVDFFEWIQNENENYTAVATAVDDAISEILARVEFTDPALMSLDDGRTITQPGTTQTGTYLARISDLMTYDQGAFFMTAGGVARYISGANHWTHTAVVATLDETLTSDLRTAVDKQRILNRLTVTWVNGSFEYAAEDTTSQDMYGFRAGESISTYYPTGAVETEGIARWIVAIRKDPTVPTRALEIKGGSDAKILQQLSLEIGNRIAWSETRGNTSSEGKIEGVQHKVKVGSLHTTKFLVSKRVKDAFTVGVSTVGGADVLYW